MQAEISQSLQFVANKDEWFPVLICPEFRCAVENQLTRTRLLFKETAIYELFFDSPESLKMAKSRGTCLPSRQANLWCNTF